MKRTLLIFLLMILLPSLFNFSPLFSQSRGLRIRIKNLDFDNEVGKQYLVIIAINRYQHWTPLKGPVKDAKDIREILESRYYIDKVLKLYDEDATKGRIIKLFKELQKKLKQEDSVFIFFAGHGHLDEASNTGHWIPVDGGLDENKMENWVPNAVIRGLIGNIKSKHILLISDSCFSGDLLDARREKPPAINNEYFKKAYKRRSRQVLTSGASERVPDSSNFARQLKLALDGNKKPILDPFMLYSEIRLAIRETLPMFGFLRGTDHQKGASFLLFLKESSEPPRDQPEFDISDLETEAKWAEWQKELQGKVDKLKNYDKNDGIAADSKKSAWERLLKAYSQNNPYSDKDERLRTYAKERIIYWKNFRKKDLVASRELRTDEEEPADVKAVESKAKRVYKNDKDYWEAEYEDGIVMVYIPAGEFIMGSDDGLDYEKPPHKVYLDGYWIGKTEVTVGQYKMFISEAGHRSLPDYVSTYSPGDNHPVIGVSWDDAAAYCKWLTKKIGLKFKLPTEAQWEKAARGTDKRKYPWGDSPPSGKKVNFADKQVWLKKKYGWADKDIDDGYAYTAPVESYPQGASPYGILNMAGNVWEWCNDWYGSDYYKNSPGKNPIGPTGGPDRVLRGGGWYDFAPLIRCAYRSSDDPSVRGYDVGFRLCQDKE